MASLVVTSSRNADKSITVSITIPPRRNGEENFGCLGRVNHVLLPINPDAFDPADPPTVQGGTIIASVPRPEVVEEMEARQMEEPDNLKSGEAYREAQA